MTEKNDLLLACCRCGEETVIFETVQALIRRAERCEWRLTASGWACPACAAKDISLFKRNGLEAGDSVCCGKDE